MLNSYSNFLKFVTAKGDAAGPLLRALKVQHAEAFAAARPVSADGEQVNAENTLRSLVGGDAWPNDSLRRLFAAAQSSLPAIYSPATLPAAAVQAETANVATVQAGPLLSIGDFIAWGRKHIGLVIVIGDAASQLPSAANFVERWEIVRPVGDAVAPAIDDFFAPGEIGIFSAEVESEFLAAVNSHLAADGVTVQAARDGRWLRAGMELFKILLPILLAAR
jgi:hypothetical protein